MQMTRAGHGGSAANALGMWNKQCAAGMLELGGADFGLSLHGCSLNAGSGGGPCSQVEGGMELPWNPLNSILA